MAQNLARWAARVGLGEQRVTTKTLRRRFFSLAGRLTRPAPRLTLHLPQRWPACEPFPAQQTSQWLSRRLTPSSVRQCHFLHSALLIVSPALIPRLIGRTASPRWIWTYSKTAWLPGRVTLM